MSRRPWIALRALPAVAFALGLAAQAQAQITHLEAPNMNGTNCVPPVVTGGTGRADCTLNTFSHVLKYNLSFASLSSAETAAHIHGPAAVGVNGPVMFSLPLGSPISGSFATTAAQEASLVGSLTYTNIHTVNFGGGEIRDQLVPAPPIGTAFCFGDGTGGQCPCSNTGAPGHGCENSATTGGAVLAATGHNSPDNVVLVATGEKPTATTIFLSGNASVGPFIFGDGLRCVGGSLKRLASKAATGGAVAYPEGAELSITARSAALGAPITPGTHRFYMTYYRDPDPAFCPTPPGGTFNGSNAVDILW
jgi:hypothetical protein